MTMREMVDQLNKWAKEYYVYDEPSVPDVTYDALYDRLVALENSTGTVLFDSPTKRVGGEPLKNFGTHKHRRRLYSLDKVQSFGELEEWVAKVNKAVGDVEFTVELKYDGLTVNVTYENGSYVRASTRGNGIEGENVTEQVRTIKSVPLSIDFKGVTEIQGEAVMRLSRLTKYNECHINDPLKNARNAAAGAIRNLDPKVTAERALDAVFYSTGYTEQLNVKSQSELVEFLKSNGFVTNGVFEKANNFQEIKSIVERIGKERQSYDFLTDGAVVKVNDFDIREELGYTDKFPKWAVAFKFDAEEVTTVLESVEWQVGRTGKLTPIGHLAPVELCGATIRRATLNNYGDITRKKLLTGAEVYLRRSNDVIPEVLGLAEQGEHSQDIEKPTVCPSCGELLTEDGANLYCTNAMGCRPQIVARIAHYCSKAACDIEGISDKTVELLVDRKNVRSAADLYKLTYSDLTDLEGFKDKKAANILGALENSKKVTLAKFIYALGLDNVGTVTARELALRFDSLENLAKADTDTLAAVQGIGEVTAQGITEYFKQTQNNEIIAELLQAGVNPVREESAKGVFEGKTVVLTGSLTSFTRSEAARLVELNGGKIASAVSKKVDLVVVGADAGGKLEKAISLGIKTANEKEFLNLLGK